MFPIDETVPSGYMLGRPRQKSQRPSGVKATFSSWPGDYPQESFGRFIAMDFNGTEEKSLIAIGHTCSLNMSRHHFSSVALGDNVAIRQHIKINNHQSDGGWGSPRGYHWGIQFVVVVPEHLFAQAMQYPPLFVPGGRGGRCKHCGGPGTMTPG